MTSGGSDEWWDPLGVRKKEQQQVSVASSMRLTPPARAMFMALSKLLVVATATCSSVHPSDLAPCEHLRAPSSSSFYASGYRTIEI